MQTPALDPRLGEDFAALPLTLLPIDTFGRRRGMHSSQIHQTIVSPDGRIWCTSPVGLVCYDGVSIRLFGRKNGLHCHGLRALTLGADNTLWITSDAGVEVVDISGTAPKSLRFSSVGIVDTIAISDTGGAIGTPNGLYWLNEAGEMRASRNAFLAGVRITSSFVAQSGDVWITGPKFGLAVRAQDEWGFIDPQAYHAIGVPHVLCAGANGDVLVGGDHGVAILRPDKTVSHILRTERSVTALLWQDDFIWMGVGEELVRLRIQGGHLAAHDKVLSDITITDLVADGFNNIWVSTNNLGMVRISGMRHIYKIEPKDEFGGVFCIKPSQTGKMIGGAMGLRLPDRRTVLAGKAVWDVAQDNSGVIWAATQAGFFNIAPTAGELSPQAYGHDTEALASPCRAIIFHDNALYVGSTKGLVKIDGETATEIRRPNGKSLGYVYSLYIGPRGELWVATLGAGLWRLKSGRLQSVLGGSITHKSNVYSLSHSGTGDLFVSHDGYISTINAAGIPSLFTSSRDPVAAWSLFAMNERYLAAGTSNGFVIYDCQTKDIIKRVANNTDTSNWEFTCSRSLTIDENGIAYCGVSSGLKTIDTKLLMDMKLRPKADVARIRWHQADPKSKNTYHLSAGKWRFDVELQHGWYLDESDCKMRYRLVGFDKNWSTLKPIGEISYTSLPAGRYSLEVCLYSPLAGMGDAATLMKIEVT